MIACNNYKEEPGERMMTFDYSSSPDFRIVTFIFNGPQIEKYIIDDIQNISGNDQKGDATLNLNLRIVKKIMTDLNGVFEIDSAPDANIFISKIPNN